MQISAALESIPGVDHVSLVMATPANLDLLVEAGLVENPVTPQPNDILLAVAAANHETAAKARELAEAHLEGNRPPHNGAEAAEFAPRSLAMALDRHPDANLALISCPGAFAGAEAEKAIRLGLDVMIFSDHVDLTEEMRLKSLADAEGRLVMGPDCGTAIIAGVPLGFANVVRRGPIGIVAASGTGLQQVACLIDGAGAGISHALGTGGRDLAAEIGGRSMIRAIDWLAADPSTEVLVLISKPPAEAVAQRVLASAAACGKPVVVNFLGAERVEGGESCHPVQTLAEAAERAVALAGGNPPVSRPEPCPYADYTFRATQKFVRGLYSGGTLCYEAQLVMAPRLGNVHSTTPSDKQRLLSDPWKSQAHTVIDLGDDLFTRGLPHPMIDHRLRNERLIQEAEDPETAVILFDVVLGHGAHADPAAEMRPVLERARRIAEEARRGLALIGFVCGTEADPQTLSRQQTALRQAGVMLARHNAEAAEWAADIASTQHSKALPRRK